MIGETLSHYRIVSKLGKGGMGEVYLAEDTRLDRKVAIKFLPPESAADEEAKKRLIREARAAAKLDHPNICAIHEVAEERSHSFIVMQYVEGETLASRIQRKPLELNESLDIAVQVADALSEAHSRGVIHRDIKPQNIMITGRGQVKVMDFGLAKLIDQQSMVENEAETQSLLTRPGLIVGTVPYMSPEQVKAGQLDARSDIFSFGSVFYEMLSGRQPFSSESTAATISAILMRKPVPLARYSAEAPPELLWIIDKALRKDREERYQTAKELLTDLRNLKRKLEFEDEINRSTPPDLSLGTKPQTSARQAVVDTANQSVAETGSTAAPTKSGAEYGIGGIGRRKMAFGAIAVAVLGLVGLGFYMLAGGGNAIDSVAIMPLTNVGADPNTEYLSDGLTESLISNLSKLSNLKVMSQSSVFRYKGREIDPQAVGRELKVSAVLTGRVVQRGDTLGISLELVDARDNRQLWGEQYNRKLSDILSLQTEISREVSEKLRVRFSGVEKERMTKHYTENTDAYQLYLQGRYYQNKRTDESLSKSIEYFQKAIAQDSNYALAYAGLADSYSYLGNHGFLPPNEVFPKGKTAALKALEIDDSLAEAHTSLGYIRVDYDWDWANAEREFKRAIELNPSYTRAHSLYAALLGARGRFDDALGEMKRALEPDPLSLYDNTNLGWYFYMARRYDDAIAQYKKTLDMDPSFAQAHLWFGQVYEQKKMYGEAITEFQKAIALYRDSATAAAALGHAYAIAGNRGEALRMLNELKDLSKKKYVSCYDIAVINAGLGDKEQVFVWLEKAYEERDGWLAFWAKVDPRLDVVRADPRFADLLRRIGHTP